MGTVNESTDIGELQRRIAELEKQVASMRHVEQLYQSILGSNLDSVFALDHEGRFTFVNSAAEALTGYSLDELVGMPFTQMCPPDQVDRAVDNFQKELQGINEDIELAILTKDGRRVELLITGGPILENDRIVGVYGIARDITERKQAEEILRRSHDELERLVEKRTAAIHKLEHEILNISAREQHRIGRDLHDGVCQILIGAEWNCDAIRRKLARRKLPEANELAYIQSVIKEANAQTRAVAHGLIPVELIESGLVPALKQLASSSSSLFRVPCVVNVPRRILIHNRATALQIYRIAQEAVHNAFKHAKPKHVQIGLAAKRGFVTLTIADDGRQILKSRRQQTGLGLKIMAYRARMIGGKLDIQSGQRHGTVVTCICPNRKQRPPR